MTYHFISARKMCPRLGQKLPSAEATVWVCARESERSEGRCCQRPEVQHPQPRPIPLVLSAKGKLCRRRLWSKVRRFPRGGASSCLHELSPALPALKIIRPGVQSIPPRLAYASSKCIVLLEADTQSLWPNPCTLMP